VDRPQPLSSKDLARQIEPHAARLRAITEPLTGDESLPTVQQLAPLAGEIAVLTGYVLNTTGDPLGTGRHNLQVLHDLGTRLAELADAALRDEPKE
jgi:hypothetical protein